MITNMIDNLITEARISESIRAYNHRKAKFITAILDSPVMRIAKPRVRWNVVRYDDRIELIGRMALTTCEANHQVTILGKAHSITCRDIQNTPGIVAFFRKQIYFGLVLDAIGVPVPFGFPPFSDFYDSRDWPTFF